MLIYSKNNIEGFCCKESFKNEVAALAKDNQLKLSSYIKYLLTQELKKAKK